MRKTFLALLLVLVPSLLFAIPKEETTYKAVNPHGQNSKIIMKGIEDAIDDMSFITKPIAKRKLDNSNTAFKSLTFDVQANKISITNDSRKPVVANADGSKTKWVREDGEEFLVTHTIKDNEIEQVFYADEGVKTLRYVFNDDDSKVTMHVRLDSPKLPAPLKYKLEYAK